MSKTVVTNRKAKPNMSKKQAARSAGKTDAKLAKLARRLRESVLPGDAPFTGKPVNDAAAFLLDVASQRTKNRSAMSLVSVSEVRRFLRIAIVNDDMPFLVDSIAATIAAQGISIDRLVHPIINVTRSNAGKLTRLGQATDKHRESMIYIETPRVDARERRELEAALRATLGDAMITVTRAQYEALETDFDIAYAWAKMDALTGNMIKPDNITKKH